MLNLQGSAWNSANSARFTVNLGVWFEDASALADRPPVKNRRPPEYQCTVRQRIGFLLEPPGDTWWTIAGPRDIAATGQSVRGAIAENALPWLDRIANPRSAVAYLRAISHEGHSPLASISIALALGDQALASELYAEWAAGSEPGVGLEIHKWAAEHDLA